MHRKKVLWVDSLERLMEKPAEQRAAFLDLLRALKLDPTWRLVVTCRDYSAETVRIAFFGEVGLTPADIDVGELNDDELDDVVADFPSLERPLSNPSLRSLLRNPFFFLDMAAKLNGLPLSHCLPPNARFEGRSGRRWSAMMTRTWRAVCPMCVDRYWWKSRCDGRKPWSRLLLPPTLIRGRWPD